MTTGAIHAHFAGRAAHTAAAVEDRASSVLVGELEAGRDDRPPTGGRIRTPGPRRSTGW
jgi:hypothetical protein